MSETMTTKEVAEVLRCSTRSILRAFKKLYPELRPGTYSKEQVIEITKYRTEKVQVYPAYKGVNINSSVIAKGQSVISNDRSQGSNDTPTYKLNQESVMQDAINKAYREGIEAGIRIARENLK